MYYFLIQRFFKMKSLNNPVLFKEKKISFEIEEAKENKKINVFTKMILKDLIKNKIKYSELYVKNLNTVVASKY